MVRVSRAPSMLPRRCAIEDVPRIARCSASGAEAQASATDMVDGSSLANDDRERGVLKGLNR
jgi:hypothetical protein